MLTASRQRHMTPWAVLIGIWLTGCAGCSQHHSDALSANCDANSAVAAIDAIADEWAVPPGGFNLPSYKDKSTAEWISVLGRSTDAQSRAEAAEALGFQVRATRLTYGGFSDVPIDSPDPPQLEEATIRPIVGALMRGLSDRNESVRTSSAVALSWMGPRAKAAVARLIHQLSDSHRETKNAVLKALGNIGPDAKSAIPDLQRMLARSDGQECVDVAEALRLIGADSDMYVPALIKVLAQDGPAHYAAMQLGQLGDPAVPGLLKALRDRDVHRRKYAAYTLANMAGWEKLTKDLDVVARALVVLARERDPDVAYKAAQALGSVHAAPEESIPALITLLNHSDLRVVGEAAEGLGEFGAEARMALPTLLKLMTGKNADDLWTVDHAIRRIGIDRETGTLIGKMKLGAKGSWLLVPLLEYPEAAVEFLQRNPHVVEVPNRDRAALVAVMRNPDGRFLDLRERLYQNEHLPLAIMAELGDAQFLRLIERKWAAATIHERTQLDACARACGKPAEHVVEIAAGRPGDFKPKSAWPGTDPARRNPQAVGHGDGITEVIVTGQIVRADGAPPIAPKFFRRNDVMLLGQRVQHEEPILFDARTGRFVFITQVFAAYSSGNNQPEPGPYQTGSSLIQIESAGCAPLQVQFYDEMPHVRITLAVAE